MVKSPSRWSILSRARKQLGNLTHTAYRVLQDGTPQERHTISYPDCACILPLDAQGNVYLVEQERFAVRETLLEVPGGGIDADEQPERAAIRELREELGIEARLITSLGIMYPSPSTVEQCTYLFLAQELTFHTAHPEPTEQLTLRTYPLEEAVHYAAQGRITSARSALCILRADAYLRSPTTNSRSTSRRSARTM